MTKAKRRLSKFNFETEGAAVALVGPAVGGAANGYTTLLTKSTKNISESLIQKATQVKVTLSIQEFLRKFFGLYYEDAEILARMMGYDTEEDSTDSYEEYIQSKVDSVEIMKSLFRSEDLDEAISNTSEQDLEKILNTQEMIEKAMSSFKDDGQKEEIKEMSKEESKSVDDIEIVKSQLAEITKQLEAYKEREVNLAKQARKEVLSDVVKVEEHVEPIFKAMEGADDETYKAAIKALTALMAVSDDSEMFVEKGVDTKEELPVKEVDSATMKIIKQKYK